MYTVLCALQRDYMKVVRNSGESQPGKQLQLRLFHSLLLCNSELSRIKTHQYVYAR
jgi:hypothetical protein